MKRRVKRFKRIKKGKKYYYYWVGYQTRNEKGTSYFEREINISSLPFEEISRIDAALRANDSTMIFKSLLKFSKSVQVGSHWTILRICEDVGIFSSLNNFLDQPCSTAILAMIVDRVSNPNPYSKRMLSSAYGDFGLARILDKYSIPFNCWYESLNELFLKQQDIEKALFPGADTNDCIFMYDITSVYFEGNSCPLAAFGYNRDRKKGKKQIVVGMLTNSSGRPLGVKVFTGNTKDETTVLEQIHDIKNKFGAKELIFVGDRGMVIGKIRDELELAPSSGIDYITALKRSEILKFANDDNHVLQTSLFDKEIAEVCDDSKRYILCFNPLKCDEDKATRKRFLSKTEEKLANIEKNVLAGRYKKEKVIAKKLYAWLNKWGMEKCFNIEYGEGYFRYNTIDEKVKELERLDGCYVITTTLNSEQMNKEEVVMRYKNLTFVEQVFRHMKTTDEFIRPLRHWTADRVKGHVFVCMLAYLVIWKARQCFEKFLDRDEQTNMCVAGSLREIWEALDRGISIGTIDIDGKAEDQLSPVPKYQKQLLKAANAMINKKEKERLKCA